MKEERAVFTPIAVREKELMILLGCGRESAVKVGEAAKAVFRVGRTKLYNVERIRQYINSQCEEE